MNHTRCGRITVCATTRPCLTPRAQRPRRSFRETVCDSFDAVLQMNLAEIDQQTQPMTAQPELGQNLFPVNRRERLHRFQFNDDTIARQQIGAEAFVKIQIAVPDRNWHLASHRYARFRKFVGHHGFVDRLQQPRSELRVHSEGRVENNLRNLVLFAHTGLSQRGAGDSTPRFALPYLNMTFSRAQTPHAKSTTGAKHSSLSDLCDLGVRRFEASCGFAALGSGRLLRETNPCPFSN